MSMSIVAHAREKSQSKSSARILMYDLAIYANDCCGVAWPGDATLYHDVNVSRQRIHEVKNALERTGELVILDRPGDTNLYFVAWQGTPLGGTSAERPGEHDRRCPLRDPQQWDRCARLWPERYPPRVDAGGGSEISDPSPWLGGSEISGRGSEISDGWGQESLTQKQVKTKSENKILIFPRRVLMPSEEKTECVERSREQIQTAARPHPSRPTETPPSNDALSDDLLITPEVEAWRDAEAPGLHLTWEARKFRLKAEAEGKTYPNPLAAFQYWLMIAVEVQAKYGTPATTQAPTNEAHCSIGGCAAPPCGHGPQACRTHGWGGCQGCLAEAEAEAAPAEDAGVVELDRPPVDRTPHPLGRAPASWRRAGDRQEDGRALELDPDCARAMAERKALLQAQAVQLGVTAAD